jgi:hypothetical protein
MYDPLFTAEADEMSRAFDPRNADTAAAATEAGTAATLDPSNELGPEVAAPPAPAAAPPPAAPRTPTQPTPQVVCPFCGILNDLGSGLCRQCSMENSAATRQATRAKIGPWFVWQARNPSAPGMNWATLTTLIEKGRVTPRSVVRGPTTGQLWRYAARVKGLSREFGVCWHCGGEVQKAARACAACKRMQLPPINPDALLENNDAMAPVGPRVPPRAPASARAGLLSLNEPVRREVPAGPAPAAGEAARHDAAEASVDPSLPVIDMDEALPSGMEFRAFQLPGESPEDGRPQPQQGSSSFRRVAIAAAITFLFLAGLLYFHPEVRAHYAKWFDGLRAWAKPASTRPLGVPEDPVTPPADRDHHSPSSVAPTILMNVPEDRPSALTAAPLSSFLSTQVASESDAPTPTTKPVAEITLSPASSTSVYPATSKPAPVVTTAPAPAKQEATGTAHVQISPPPSDPQTAERRAWELYERAIKSEQRSDYAAAVKEYQWIEQLRLPEGVGPSDVESRLSRARKLMQDRENASTNGRE